MGTPLQIPRAGSVTAKGHASFAVLLLVGFSHLALAGANEVAGRPVYGWSTLTLDSKPARGSAGFEISPDMVIGALPRNAVLVVVGGRHIVGEAPRRVIGHLRREVAHGRQLAGISDAITVKAAAEVLAGQPGAVHRRADRLCRSADPFTTVQKDLWPFTVGSWKDRAPTPGLSRRERMGPRPHSQHAAKRNRNCPIFPNSHSHALRLSSRMMAS